MKNSENKEILSSPNGVVHPNGILVNLKEKLAQAIEEEEYEEAAKLRDEIRRMQQQEQNIQKTNLDDDLRDMDES